MKHKLDTISGPSQVNTQRPNYVHTTELRYTDTGANKEYHMNQ